MQIVEKRLTELRPYENNPRKNDAAVEYVANSIKEFGFKVPIVIDKNNVIVAGHTRLKAAAELGLETVPCVIADDLTEEQIKALRLADNKTAEAAEWEYNSLMEEIYKIEGVDMDAFGFFRFDSIDEFLDDELGDFYSAEDFEFKLYGISFAIPIEYEEPVKAWMKENGNKALAQRVLNFIREGEDADNQ